MKDLVLAVPKGRILEELLPILDKAGIKIEDDFFNGSRKLYFNSNIENLKVIKCRSFDIATFISYGAADIGICGSDVVAEFDYKNIYNILDLEIGKCRLSLAGEKESFKKESYLKIATKYPKLTKQYFSNLGINVELIKLNGAIELAAKLGFCDYIVDLVSSGATLKENGLKEIENILEISSQLIVNQTSLIVKNDLAKNIIERFVNVN